MTNAFTPKLGRISNSLDDFWTSFTANRQLKASQRLLESAEGMYFTCTDGRREITEAASKQIDIFVGTLADSIRKAA